MQEQHIVKASDIPYFSSINLEGTTRREKYSKMSPTEIWLARIKENVITMRREYQSDRKPFFLIKNNEKKPE